MNYILKPLLIISVIIPLLSNVHFCLGRKTQNGEKLFSPHINKKNQNSRIELNLGNGRRFKNENSLSNTQEETAERVMYTNKNNMSKNFFIRNNYKAYYKIITNKTKNATVREVHYAHMDLMQKKNKDWKLPGITRKINKANTLFTLFNSINNDMKTFQNDINDADIVDDVTSASSEESSFDVPSEHKKGELMNTLIKENNLNSVVETTNNCNLTSKHNVSFLKKVLEGGKTISLLSLWYVCNILYNIENKKALNILNLPITIAITQIFVGMPIFIIPWILKLRNKPELFYDEQELNKIKTSDRNAIVKMFQKHKLFLKTYSSIMKQSIYHGYVHLLSVVAMGAGAISFVHIVKALEPIFASVFSFFLLNNRMSLYTYLSLLPIIFGVSLASIKELSFTYKALYSTLLANIFSTMRAIEAKKMMGKNLQKLGKNLTPANIFALLTVFSTVFLAPALFLDVFKWKNAYHYLMHNNVNIHILARHVIMSGLWFYLYNELSFIALHRLNNITHAVANTVKRVFLILTSFFIFGTKFSFLGGVGSSIAVGGTLLYSLSKQKFG